MEEEGKTTKTGSVKNTPLEGSDGKEVRRYSLVPGRIVSRASAILHTTPIKRREGGGEGERGREGGGQG